ncbi:RNA polymerase-associated protein RapA [Oleiagrimonas sp. C23AA]|uniref:RNA polymerase-associated protein RapA n=1 Tax=Oleiagrimonas sp. C23AA TaxID=2719047 RepID=UPI001421A5DA|nr:RNA polymerase-associated protein RapA [Oleiagrimonas sp. C23AA]NII10071.1 RNA polymerase-associated protein RapA [Oleiagrimonas sp. C23AA]
MFVPGQRWISAAEPELGLGTVLRVDGRSVQVLFAKSGVLRQYAQDTAPLTRAEFRVGQRIAGKGVAFLIERVEIHDGLITYRGEGRELHEGQLDDEQSVSQADDRLMGGRVDAVDKFDLRYEAMQRRANARRSPAWGLASSRIDLVPHQLRVAGVAASRRPPRVLLADEVGLGKTIEAGMIAARQIASGRAQRVLVLLPDALVNQWFVELLRRFNLAFAIFDEERCQTIESEGDGRNPFEDEQLVIAGFSLFGDEDGKRREQLLAAGWELLIVDEAHHLEWRPDAVSPRYELVEALAQATPGVILLTATPEQLGRTGHFARLRLLDPARYSDLEHYLTESDDFAALSDIADTIRAGDTLSQAQGADLAERLGDDATAMAALAGYPDHDGSADALLGALIDRHGTGRAMFRNRRAHVGGFPARVPDIIELPGDLADPDAHAALLEEFRTDIQQPPGDFEPIYDNDPRIEALVELLDTNPDDKFLLICRTQAKVQAIEDALRTRSGVGVARFHEGLSLLQRDRNAAWFAQADGARLLLCSEIGSEGRNFQFAHHLVLWDLPLDPDLLEQRIGRLDRIGQRSDIDIHVPVLEGSAQQLLARWFDEGVDAFDASPADGRELLRRFGERLVASAEAQAEGQADDAALEALIEETRRTHEELQTLVNSGRDRLLELATEREPQAEALGEALAAEDADGGREGFVLRLMEEFGVHVDDIGAGVLSLDPEYLTTDAFPGFREGPVPATFSRATALAREELTLLRLDHPMVLGGLDLLLASETGNAAFLVDDGLTARTALLQAVFVLECIADHSLDAARFLPPQPLLVTIDTRLLPRPDFEPSAPALRRATERKIEVNRYRKFLTKLVPPMLERAETVAGAQAAKHADAALEQARAQLGAERERLEALARVNPAVSEADVKAVSDELAQLELALPSARLRLDAVRFVVSPDFLAMR